ncbi:hypothetical protein CEXT_760431 [Caerostris extrusa]|uniref:Uncharacterized protein n=1 Tax=Caerostris extrusa TaxID=172846 RepID=A0AAV4NDZ0_CAEEX|nr:hypothetical protein CEXT_760431 [Caerostris extrusa]
MANEDHQHKKSRIELEETRSFIPPNRMERLSRNFVTKLSRTDVSKEKLDFRFHIMLDEVVVTIVGTEHWFEEEVV